MIRTTPANPTKIQLDALNEATKLCSDLGIGCVIRLQEEPGQGWWVEAGTAWEADQAKLRDTLKRRGYSFEVLGSRTRIYRSLPASMG